MSNGGLTHDDYVLSVNSDPVSKVVDFQWRSSERASSMMSVQSSMFHPRPLHGVTSPLPVRPSPERSPPKLCENGRAYITDPSTGQNVCLCQLEAHPAHSLQAHPALRGVGRALPAPRPRFADLHSFHPAAQLSAMAPLGEQTNGLLPPHIAFHPYGAMYASMEGAGSPLRRAATRETTGPLKAWLSEHKKNPYPTKAEKIMLAIITRMTLTQVSTWFANARRRLKKDNRLSSGDGDGEDDSVVDMDSDREGDLETASVDGACLVTPSHMGPLRGESARQRDTAVDADRSTDRVTSGEDRTPLRADAKLSSEGEVEPDSFSDISDDDNDLYRRSSHNKPSMPHPRASVITSSPTSCSDQSESASSARVQGGEAEEQAPGVDLTRSTNHQKTAGNNHGEKRTEPKPKPKIWSISHILDS
ncbi:hypothetical protein RRG08_041943 [Elysia crispata]|uniref:Homeobox domain-containing protein n=1 Tax=Elysia crispata TaxID=231223 RepID=A0AAE0XX75_9GAST|nr:hypothetical protein RRG08_041943 [Elysia crispata]